MLAVSLNTAATGMQAQTTNVDVIANNIANSNTSGFKGSQAQFADLLYMTERMAGVPFQGTATTGQVPQSGQAGLGVQTVAIQTLNTQGPLQQTGDMYNLALQGRGWFQVQGPNGQTLYTRAGNFGLNSTGQLVTMLGYPLTPNITFPTTVIDVQINTTGAVYVDQGNPPGTYTQVGQIQLAVFPNDAGMQAIGNNLYQITDASGAAQTGNPGDPGYATTIQKYLEQSNVDPVKEITTLITAQRNYELNSKVITAADEMYQTITKGTL